MRPSWPNLFILAAVIVFALGYLLFLTNSNPSGKTVEGLLFGGLALFALGHIAIP